MAITQGTQFIGVSPSVDLTEKKSSSINAETEVCTIEDIVDASRPYKVYTALLTQTGTSAPVATVLENTIGNIIWSYDDIGRYVTNGFVFDSNKTIILINDSIEANQFIKSVCRELGSDILIVSGFLKNGNVGSLIDIEYFNSILYNTSIEIRVYN